ncbi:DUF2188 domain-containing protein [Cupriavidus basilensis]|uniref:DUF2188 domain-containing protein n=1 Tax=Cupriavidus basilensis TaxID=68895 RepID=A0A643FSU2_9BURK|nr:DUF2188 domain-containing protein [Cupriavidus basilensis]QOT82200.1 DUF2188 domain-containing protein [Cupriavidus basilensis]
MTTANVHVLSHHDDRDVKLEGATGAGSHHSDQAEVVAAGIELARREKCELLVLGRDSQIRMRNSYRNDPRNVPG